MDKDHSAMPWQNEVRSPGKIPPMQSEAVPEAVDDSPDDHFRLRIAPADRGHVSTALFFVVNVCHQAILRRTSFTKSSTVSIVIGRLRGYSFWSFAGTMRITPAASISAS